MAGRIIYLSWGDEMKTREAIFRRRSVRDFKSIPLKEDEIEEILKAAFSAPTAANVQPWESIRS